MACKFIAVNPADLPTVEVLAKTKTGKFLLCTLRRQIGFAGIVVSDDEAEVTH